MDLGIKTTDVASPSDRRWLLSPPNSDALLEPVGITLDGDLFPDADFPDGLVPSGTVIGRVAATKLGGPYGGRSNEVQQFDLGGASAGTFTVTFDGETTGAINWDATAADVQAALEGLSNIDPGDVEATGGPLPGTAVVLTFGGQHAGENVPEITIDGAGLTGAAVTITTTTEGGSAVSDGRERASGHTLTDVKVEAGRRTTVALVWKGRVRQTFLPDASGLDAAAEADLDQIRYE
jgi:hypothetical protein